MLLQSKLCLSKHDDDIDDDTIFNDINDDIENLDNVTIIIVYIAFRFYQPQIHFSLLSIIIAYVQHNNNIHHNQFSDFL